jgi:ribosomal protein S18 acetylase RimI-like enzyme
VTREPPLHIRRYREADHDAVWALHNLALNQVGAHAGNGPWDDDLHHVSAEYLDSGGEFLVGVADARIVAMGALKRLGPDRAEVKRMRVHPDCQRRGFGQAILDGLQRRAAELGVRHLRLETTAGQVAAQGLYRANGFVEVGRTTFAGFDVLLFEKQL